MAFRHNKKESGDHGYQWTAYSDLFTALSIVFLFMYVVATLRLGVGGVQKFHELKTMTQKVESLREQMKVYESLKEDYLKSQASHDETEEYKDLMSQLDLLQDQNHNEAEKLRQQAQNNEKKEKALNHYQAMIKNIITANIVAKSRLKTKETVIEDQVQEIQSKDNKIDDQKIEASALHRQIDDQQAEIALNQKKVALAQKSLEMRNHDLKSALAQNQISKGEFQKKWAQAQAKHNADVAKLNSQAGQLQSALALKQGELQNLGKELGQSQQNLAKTKGELNKAQEALAAKKKLASTIQENFKRAGIKAEVDTQTGDVTLAFGDQYFDTGSSKLKKEMRKKLEELIPVYSQSLFQDPKISQKITNVEIIGFASPTFNGKYIDPESLNPQDRNAVNFNLDLSFSRAKSIFNHIFDQKKMNYPHQRRLLPLVKVTGRSFLAEGSKGRNLASGVSENEYCKIQNCTKSQRVIIKFNVEEK